MRASRQQERARELKARSLQLTAETPVLVRERKALVAFLDLIATRQIDHGVRSARHRAASAGH
jgi:hypothetical protein